jgi:K+-transporting ATPase ATPase B chain
MTSDRSTVQSSSEAAGRPSQTLENTSPGATPRARRVGAGLLDPKLLWLSLPSALRKLDPRTLWRNPVMFVVEIGSFFTTVLAVLQPSVFAWAITTWLWLTVVFANLAEAVAEGRGKAQAETLRRARQETTARRLLDWSAGATDVAEEAVPANALQLGDVVVVEAGQVIPGDGDVVEGIAAVDESVITGESAPVVRESGGDRSAVTGGPRSSRTGLSSVSPSSLARASWSG